MDILLNDGEIKVYVDSRFKSLKNFQQYLSQYLEVEYTKEIVLDERIGAICYKYDEQLAINLYEIMDGWKSTVRIESSQGFVEEMALFKDKLKGEKYTLATKRNYIGHVMRFLKYINCNRDKCNELWLNSYVEYLRLFKRSSFAFLSQAICSVKVYSRLIKGVKLKYTISDVNGQLNQCPQCLENKQILDLLNSESNIKTKLYMHMAYGAGLRVTEISSLRIQDINFEENSICIRDITKSNTRFAMLSRETKSLVKEYLVDHKPVFYLFENRISHEQLCVRSIQRQFKSSCERAGLDHVNGLNVLRNSFIKNLIEGGLDKGSINKLVGFESPVALSRFRNVSAVDYSCIKSPLDNLYR